MNLALTDLVECGTIRMRVHLRAVEELIVTVLSTKSISNRGGRIMTTACKYLSLPYGEARSIGDISRGSEQEI